MIKYRIETENGFIETKEKPVSISKIQTSYTYKDEEFPTLEEANSKALKDEEKEEIQPTVEAEKAPKIAVDEVLIDRKFV